MITLDVFHRNVFVFHHFLYLPFFDEIFVIPKLSKNRCDQKWEIVDEVIIFGDLIPSSTNYLPLFINNHICFLGKCI